MPPSRLQKAKASDAILAMRALGIGEAKTKQVLKKLLKLYDKNWALIEEENYRALADAIFEEEDKAADWSKKPVCDDEEDEIHDEPEQPLRMSRKRNFTHMTGQENEENEEGTLLHAAPAPSKLLRGGHNQVLNASDKSIAGPAGVSYEKNEIPGNCSGPHPKEISESVQLNAAKVSAESASLSSEAHARKGKSQLQPAMVSPHDTLTAGEGSAEADGSKEVRGNSCVLLVHKKALVIHALIEPKEEPFTFDTPEDEAPIAAIHPGDPLYERPLVAEADGRNSLPCQSADGWNSFPSQSADGKSDSEGDPSYDRPSVAEADGQSSLPSQSPDGKSDSEGILASSSERLLSVGLPSIQEESSNMEIASSPMGDVKISLSFQGKKLKAPSLDELLKSVEEKCLRSYKILDPNFSAASFLDIFIESAQQLGGNSVDKTREEFLSFSADSDLFRNSSPHKALGGAKGIREEFCVPSSACGTMNGSVKHLEDANKSNAVSLAVAPQAELTHDDIRTLSYMNDITKGGERVTIPWVNEVNATCPPPFFYTRQNLIFKCACVDFSLSQIRDDRCCSSCVGDCLMSPLACTCATEREVHFVYTSEGLLREEFLEECKSLSRNPQQGCFFYCDECPIEKVNNDTEPCKGHLAKRFIRECWIKCGCTLHCGNRVVQRGITCKLQVFYTPEGKGWGLRSLEDLPKGAFVCEYVGEIITCEELQFRNVHHSNALRKGHLVLLDSAWNSGVEEKQALCLDANFYGNVARFINHRCLDANLIEIPVEVETADHHYYHLALFTTRKVVAMEELTWDYGIDFENHSHPVRSFLCKCGSQFCRNMKRPNRSRC